MTKQLWCAAFLIAAAVAGRSAAEEFVVIESTAPQLPAGSVVAGERDVTLGPSTAIVLVGGSGRTITLAGPFSGPVAANAGGSGDPRLLTALASLVHRKGSDTSAVGAVRAADTAWRQASASGLADVLAIDVADGGDVCLYDPAKAELVRSPTDPTPSVEILNASTGSSVRVEWEGVQRKPWPGQLAIEDGETFVLEQPGKSAATVITFHLLRDPDASNVERVVHFVEAGCEVQARLLLAVIAKAAK